MKDETQFNQLQQAVCAGNRDALKLALAEGFKVNAKDGFGQTLLMFAAEAGKADMVELLIAAKAKLDTRDQFSYLDGGGQTALHRAVEKRHVKVVNMLLGAGAKVDVVDKMAKTPLEYAIGNKDLEMAEVLLKAGANPNGSGKTSTPISSAAALKSSEAVELLLRYGAHPNHPADVNWPVLGYAALLDMVESCRLLLKAGARVNAKNSDGRTAFEIINKPVDATVWKRLSAAQAEELKHALQKREEIKAMLIDAAGKEQNSLLP